MNSGLYKITHVPTGRIYIGQSKNLRKRESSYKNSGGSGNSTSVIRRAILKHGWDKFSFEVIAYATGQEYLNDTEQKAISVYGCMVPNGFNVEVGGMCSPVSEETKKRISDAKRGIKLSAEHKKKIGIGSAAYWKSAPKEKLEKNAEHARNINLGKQLDDSHKKALSETRKRLFAEGKIVHPKPNLGRTFPEETRQKMRESALRRWAIRKGA